MSHCIVDTGGHGSGVSASGRPNRCTCLSVQGAEHGGRPPCGPGLPEGRGEEGLGSSSCTRVSPPPSQEERGDLQEAGRRFSPARAGGPSRPAVGAHLQKQGSGFRAWVCHSVSIWPEGVLAAQTQPGGPGN